MDSQKYLNIRKALAWAACNKLDKIWHSNLPSSVKVQTFQTLIEPVHTYGSDTWTLSTKLEKRLDGTYTNLLRRVQNISRRDHATLNPIYGDLTPLSLRLKQKRLQFAGHCHRAKNEVISSLLLWHPTGRVHPRKLTYPETIARDSGLDIRDLSTAMQDRAVWREIVMGIPTTTVAEG